MSNDMKLIMESWRASVLQESSAMKIADQLTKQIEDEVEKSNQQKNEVLLTATVLTITIKALSVFLVKMATASALSGALAKFGAWANKKLTGQDSEILNNLTEFFDHAAKATATLFIPKALKGIAYLFIRDPNKRDKFNRWVDKIESFFALIVLLYVSGAEIYESIKDAGNVNVFTDLVTKAGIENAEQKKALLDLLERTVDVGEASATANDAKELAQMSSMDRDLFLASLRRDVTLYFPPWPF